MAIIGAHALLYTSDPNALRTMFATPSGSSMWMRGRVG